MNEWSLFTSHGLVLISIAKNPDRTAHDIGDDVGVTERTAHKIIIDLEEAGYITRIKVGRQNKYRIHPNVTIRDEVTEASLGELLVTLGCTLGRQRKKSLKTRNIKNQ